METLQINEDFDLERIKTQILGEIGTITGFGDMRQFDDITFSSIDGLKISHIGPEDRAVLECPIGSSVLVCSRKLSVFTVGDRSIVIECPFKSRYQ